MRSYSNFLLFEGALTNLPLGSAPIVDAANFLVNPTVSIIETDCGTLLGSTIPLTYDAVGYEAVGFLELFTQTFLTVQRIQALLGQGVTSIKIRSTSTCVSKGGICATCYNGSFRPTILPAVGSLIKLSSEFVYSSQIIIGNGVDSVYPVTQNSTQYSKTNVSYYPEVLSLTDTQITFSTIRQTTDIFTLHYYKPTSDPLLEYVAKSYSGSLIGLAPLPSHQLLIKPSLYSSLFSDSHIQVLRNELDNYKADIPPQYLDYCDTIVDKLEKVLYIIYTYAIYGNIQ